MKNILLSLALSLVAVPLTVNAATNVDRTDSFDSQSGTIIAGFGFIEKVREDVEGINELVNDTEEDGDAINTGVGQLKTKFSGGEDSVSDEVVEEVELHEGAESPEVIEDSGDSF